MLAAVGDLQKQGLKGMVIDLRGNPGGLLDKAVDIADDFLAERRDRERPRPAARDDPDLHRSAHKGQKLESLPIIVVVDEGSASASEILAAALHDNNRSLLVGGAHVRQGLRPERHSAGRRRVAQDDHRALLPAQQRADRVPPGHHAGHLSADEPRARAGPAQPGTRGQAPRHATASARTWRRSRRAAPEPAPNPPGDAPSEEPSGKEGEETRRGRVVDFQLQAALNILKWQLAHPTAMPEAGVEKAEK